MREPILVLGATGSIGTQTLDILRYDFHYQLVGVSCARHTEILEPYLPYFDSLRIIAVSDKAAAKAFAQKHPSIAVLSGPDANIDLIHALRKTTVFNALMGNVGLKPSLTALRGNRDLLLANKESLVIGSSLIAKELLHSRSHLYPVDSEHVALAKLLAAARRLSVSPSHWKKLIVTASGGSLRDFSKEALASATPEQVLHHPTWHMGNKITVDSATLVNKGYEVIEASVLFGVPLAKVSAVICRESLVHAELLYEKKGRKKTLREYSPVDMKVAIAYALSKGKLPMHHCSLEDEEAIRSLHFDAIDPDFYPLFPLTVETYRRFGNIGMLYYNAVDTAAIASFLAKEIPFDGIREALRYTFDYLSENQAVLPPLTEKTLPDAEKNAASFASQVLIRMGLLLPGKGNV